MRVHLQVRNDSARGGLYRQDALRRLAERICAEEGPRTTARVELSVLFCDDAFITELNRKYRKKNAPTDVLSFAQKLARVTLGGQPAPRALGDIVISLETVERNCGGDRDAMRQEVRLLFCHGLLHLLGDTHKTARELAAMMAKQDHYLSPAPARLRRRKP